MAGIDERIERLIIRRLDGELNADEELELDRELLRSPEARRLLEEHEQIDSVAAAALADVIGEDKTVPVGSQVAGPAARRDTGRFWWVLPAAVAAAVAFAVVWITPESAGPPVSMQPVKRQVSRGVPVVPRVGDPYEDSGVYRVNHGLDQLNRSVDRNRLYILGPDGNLYVVDQQHTRTTTKPRDGSVLRRVAGDL
jgi:hypothetical protein